jgi:hypothetical protein
MIAGAVAALLTVIIVLSVVGGDDSEREGATPPASSSAPITLATTTVRTPTPNILGAGSTNMLLWTFDDQLSLQTLDLDTGELRPLGVRSGVALFPLYRNVVVFDGDNGSRIVSAIGVTSAENLGGGAYPVIERDGRKLWTLSEESPRRWQRRAVDGTILHVLPSDPSVGLLAYSERAVLLISRDGTSLYDLVTRQQQLITAAHAVAAGGNILLARNCTERVCNLRVIDVQTRAERTLLSNVPIEDAVNATLSPDGAYLAITNKGDTGRRSEIVAVNNATTVWKSPVGAYGPSAWSWSPDSNWFFVAMSGQQVLAVSMRNPSASIDIPLIFTPLSGLAVTYR